MQAQCALRGMRRLLGLLDLNGTCGRYSKLSLIPRLAPPDLLYIKAHEALSMPQQAKPSDRNRADGDKSTAKLPLQIGVPLLISLS